MICVRLTGGLGNQMFQYAFAKYYQSQKATTYLDLSFYSGHQSKNATRKYELSVFSISIPVLPFYYYHYLYSQRFFWKILRKISPLSFQFVSESKHTFNETYLQLRGNCVVSGYFQSEKYFANLREAVRKDFTFKRPLSSQNHTYLQAIQKSESVFLHVRRGDFASHEATNKIHGVLPLTYYLSAIEQMNKKLNDPKYFIFSDDVLWIKTNFEGFLKNGTIIEGNHSSDAWQDMFLMSRCKHAITANSSFSWWGAWLINNSDKIVISPQAWVADPQLNMQMSDLIPAKWIRI